MFLKKQSFLFWIFIYAFCLLGLTYCGGGSSSSGGDEEGTSLAGAFPSDLILVSPTVARSADWLSVSAARFTDEDDDGFDDFGDDDDGDDQVQDAQQVAEPAYVEELTVLQDILNGETVSDCSFTLSLDSTYGLANCFGPQISYTNHPDATDPEDEDGTIGGGDLGIMSSTVYESTEACSAGQLNAQIETVAAQVNSVIYAMANLPCLAGVSGLSLPAAGETLDLTTTVSSGFTSNSIAFSVTSATLARATDTAEGYAVYILTLSGTATDENETAHQINVRLKHIATATDNSTYRGKISYTLNWDETQDTQGNCPAGGTTDAVTISYEKTAATAMVFEMQSANFCGEADPYVSDTNYTVDLSKKYDAEDEPTGWANSGNYDLFSYNPENGAGDFVTAWQAGMNDNARILKASVEESSGSITGCAYFGYGVSFENGVTPDINGMYCSWSGPGAEHTIQELAQRQCFSYFSTDSVFIPDATVGTEAITFAPTNSCDATADDFTYHDNTDPPHIEYDGAADGDITNNLIGLEEIDVGDITPPTEVDE